MIGRSFLVGAMLLAGTHGWSAETAPSSPTDIEILCGALSQGTRSKVYLHTYPAYFFAVFPKKSMVSFRGADSSWVLDLKTGERFKVPGNEDPVPLPDEKTLTNPDKLRFFVIDDYRNGKETPPILTDEAMGGVYQSIATLGGSGKPGSENNFRILTDAGKATYRDYKVSYDKKGTPKVSPQGEPVTFCKDRDIKLPKLSKDGRLLAAVDENEKPATMKVFEVNKSGTCKEVFDLGFMTGKVDFSYDNKKMVFHAGASMGKHGDYQPAPKQGDKLNVYEIEMKTRKLRQLTFNSEFKNSYYPVYKKDGSIVYLDQTLNKDEAEYYEFVVADPKQANSVSLKNYVKSEADSCCGPEAHPRNEGTLGKEWIKICVAEKQASMGEAMLALKALDSKQCKQLVDKTWERIKDAPSGHGLTREALLSACPAPKAPPQVASLGEKTVFFPVKKPHEITGRKCSICHGDSIPFNDLAKLKSTPSQLRPGRSMYDEMVRRLKSTDPSEKMPKGGELSESELKTLLSALE